MIHILHGFSNVDSEFKPRNLRQEVHYIESPVSTHCMALVPTSNLFYLCVELKNRQQ